jgi:hypothetical protein
MDAKLLTRDSFRKQTLARHNGICCIPDCNEPSVDAHHILNRNLWTSDGEEGGYFIENGANLCGKHHLDAEQTIISVKELWEYIGVTKFLPNNFNPESEYDCWGNAILSNGLRERGPMADDEGCRKALRAANLEWTLI